MNTRKLLSLFLLAVMLAATQSVHAQGWERKTAPLMTPWGETLTPATTWQEYPRPQLVRPDWMNLNGEWQYFRRTSSENVKCEVRDRNFSGTILVPFGVESALSGIMVSDYDTNSRSVQMYRRYFTLPESYHGKTVLLHFGAVDWSCVVYVNRKEAGRHTGGFDPFTIDITPYLNGEGEQELQIAVQDPGSRGGQPLGKQTNNPGGIWYTPVSGIWQTVWLEPVNKAYVDHYEVYPDIDRSEVAVRVASATPDATATITVSYGGQRVAEVSGVQVNADSRIAIPDAKLWSPDEPNLYDLDIKLYAGGEQADAVKGYFGMRKFSKAMVDGHPAFMLNNKPIYMYGPLDQGWWPDGLLTPPSYEAMVYDLEVIKSFGMNMVRKHIKVEPDLWYEWCDRHGLIVWQDMPNGGTSGSIGTTAEIQQNFYDESVRIVNALKQHPSIAAWVVYNEGWGQDAENGSTHTLRGVRAVRQADEDPYRLVHSVTGWTDFEVGDMLDIHSYPSPNVSNNPSNDRVNVCGEFGGITLLDYDHLWAGSQMVYTSVQNSEELTALYNRYTFKLQELMPTGGIWGSVYTQITDVEQEVNGLLTYDRKALKVTDSQRERMRRHIERTIHSRYTGATVVVPDGRTSADILWRNTTTEPQGNWFATDYDDSAWSEDKGGFGSINTTYNRTRWNTTDIWLRRHFTLSNIDPELLEDLALHMYHDEDAEVYLNGVHALSISGFNNSYQYFEISPEALQALNLNGDNVMAIHCKQSEGGQFIDAGLYLRQFTPCDALQPTELADRPQPVVGEHPDNLYLMAYSSAAHQQMNYAYSNDGVTWQTLNGGRAVLDGVLAEGPCLRRIGEGSAARFYLVYATEGQNVWMLTSSDLVNWTAAEGTDNGILLRLSDISGDAERLSSPELFYDEVQGRYWITMTVNIDGREDVYSVNSTDLRSFSSPARLYSNVNGHDVTLTRIGNDVYTVFVNKSNNRLYMGSSPRVRSGQLSTSRLFSDTFPTCSAPTVFPSLHGDGWLMYALSNSPILFTTSADQPVNWRPYGGGELSLPESMGQGSIEIISREELQRLLATFVWESADILPTAETQPQQWRYSTTSVTGWEQADFADNGWKTGLGGFGAGTPPNSFINTSWKSADIYLRRNLDLTGFTEAEMNALSLRVHHDEDVEVYLNGVLAFEREGYATSYENYEFSAAAKAALKADATNVIAVHCHQEGGAQYIDVGVRGVRPIKESAVVMPKEKRPSDSSSAAVYTLSGQRVDAVQTMPRGIYIRGGKAVVNR